MSPGNAEPVGLDQEAAVAGGVSGQVEHRSGPPPEVEHRAVVDGAHPLVTGQAEGLVQLRADDVRVGSRHAEPGEEHLGVADGGDLRQVGDDRHLRDTWSPATWSSRAWVTATSPTSACSRARRPTARDGVDQDGSLRPADSSELAAG